MKKLLTLFTLFITLNSCGQSDLDRPRAEESVMKYMSSKHKNYEALTFGEFFSQYYSEDLQKIAKTKKIIKYSIVHTYSIKNVKTTHMYFHLDDSYNVIGNNTDEEMSKLVMNELNKNPIFDSIMKSMTEKMLSDTTQTK